MFISIIAFSLSFLDQSLSCTDLATGITRLFQISRKKNRKQDKVAKQRQMVRWFFAI